MLHQPPFPLCRLSLLLAAVFAVQAYADEQVLPTVEVAAQSRADLDPQSLENPYRMEKSAQVGSEIIRRPQIEALAPRDLFDLLDKATGLNVTYHGRRSPYFVDVRGGGTLTYIIDGAILPTTANRILQKIPMAAIEEVQIVRGATSLNLGPSIPIGASNSGSGTNSGFVIIKTRRPKQTEAELSAYLEKSKHLPVANGQSLYAGTRLGNPDSMNGYVGGMLSRSDKPSEDDRFDGQDAQAGLFTTGFTRGRFTLNLMGYQDSGRFEMQRGLTKEGTLHDAKWYYDPLKTKILSSDATLAWTPRQITLVSGFLTRYSQHEYNQSFSNDKATERDFEEKTHGFSLRHNARLFDNTLLQLGFQQTRSQGDGANCNTPYTNWDTRVQGWSASIEQGLFNNQLTLDAGYRRDQKHINHAATKPGNLAANADQDLAPATVYALGAHWQAMDDLALDARYLKGDEGTSGDFELQTADGSALHATRQDRRELAVEYSRWELFRPTLTWFDVKMENEKVASNNTYFENGDEYYYYTETDSRRSGLELLIKGAVAQTGTLYRLSWTHMTKNESGNQDITGKTQPENTYVASLEQGWRDYRINASVKRVDAWDTSTSPMGTVNGLDLGGYTRIDANVMRDFPLFDHTLSVQLYGRNLTNEKFATRYTTGYYYDRGLTLGLQATAKL